MIHTCNRVNVKLVENDSYIKFKGTLLLVEMLKSGSNSFHQVHRTWLDKICLSYYFKIYQGFLFASKHCFSLLLKNNKCGNLLCLVDFAMFREVIALSIRETKHTCMCIPVSGCPKLTVGRR